MTPKNLKTLALATTAALFLASCGATEQEGSSTDSSAQSGDSGSSSGSSTGTESSGMEGSEMSGMEETTGSEVTVGGFTVEAPGGGEVTVPEVAVRPEEAQAYLDEVRPVAEDSVRDISDLVEPEVSLENGNISLGLNVNSLDEARRSIEDGADQLREIQPPDGLEDVNERLIQVYEDAIPAYQDVVDAAESGDPQEITDVVQQSLSDIESFDTQVEAIVQDVQQAAEGQPQ